MDLKPVKKQILFDYKNNCNVEMKKFSTSDFILDIDGSTQAGAFALRFANDKTNGTFLEIGAGHWKNQNNTYILEKYFDWNGLAIDISPQLAIEYNKNRSSKCISEDAMSVNWDNLLEENNFSKRIDYLQIDIDNTPHDANLYALINLPLSRYRFSVITIEHFANFDPKFTKARDIQREILFNYGYKIVAAGFHEDWWVDEKLGMAESEYVDIISETYKGKFI